MSLRAGAVTLIRSQARSSLHALRLGAHARLPAGAMLGCLGARVDEGGLRDGRAARGLGALVARDHAEPLRGGVAVLVAAARQVDEDDRVRSQLATQPQRVGDGV